MREERQPGTNPEFDNTEGLALAVSYLENPAAVECPTCGPGGMAVVGYLNAEALREGRQEPASPEGDYAVVLYCRGCHRAAALSFRSQPDEDRRAA